MMRFIQVLNNTVPWLLTFNLLEVKIMFMLFISKLNLKRKLINNNKQ